MMHDPADAWEVECRRYEEVRMARFCGECGRFIEIPEEHGDPEYGWCPVEKDWVYAGRTVAETGCDYWRG